MVDTLTESFCERCGTRYEFRAPTRLNPLRKTRGLIGGLKNYLTSQDALSDAVGDAMRTEEDQLASAQLDAFHETFNFCIGCRQYTCLNCWNDDAGRCRTCTPIPGTDDLAERLIAMQPGATAAAMAASASEPMLAGDELSRRLGLDEWPVGDAPLVPAPTNGDTPHAWPEPDPLPVAGSALDPDVSIEPELMPEPTVAEVEPEVEPEPYAALEPVVAEDAQPWLEPGPETWAEPVAAEAEPWPVVVEPEPAATEAQVEVEPEPDPAPTLRVVAWEADSAYGPVEPVGVAEPEPVAAVDLEPEPAAAVLEPDTAPVEAEPIAEPPQPEPVAIAPDAPQPMPQMSPISETILHFPPRPAPSAEEPALATEGDTPELAARRAQLDSLGLGDPVEGPLAAERQVLPYRSRGAAASAAELAALRGGTGFWEASAREVAGVATQVGVQNCGECGLSLSATARFCRRCGTRQARSA